jgi:hypothetical protein
MELSSSFVLMKKIFEINNCDSGIFGTNPEKNPEFA